MGRMRNRIDRRNRGPKGDSRDFGGDRIDQNFGSIKMRIPSFQGDFT